MEGDQASIEVAGITFNLRSETIPLAHILLARPLTLTTLAPELHFSEANAAKDDDSKSARDDSFNLDSVLATLLGGDSDLTEMEGLKLVGLRAVPLSSPILATTRMETRHLASLMPISPGTQQIWRAEDRFAVANKGQRNDVVVIPVTKCVQLLRDCITSMHIEYKDSNGLEDVYRKLLDSSGSPVVCHIFATVDGAKTITRLARRAVQADDIARDAVVEVTVADPEGDAQITIPAAFTLAFMLNRMGQNREPVTAVELLNAATLAMRNSIRAVATRQHVFPSEAAHEKPKDANAKRSITHVEKPTFTSLMQDLFVRSVFRGDCASGNVSDHHVDHAVSGVERFNILDSGTLERLPSDLLLKFKRFFSQSKHSARNVLSSSKADDMALATSMMKKAVDMLWEMDGACRPTSVDGNEQRRNGSAMTRDEAMRHLEMAAAFTGKPASQSLWDFAQSVHPDAAGVAFSYEYLIQRPSRGIAKGNSTDFESFILMSILLSLALAIETKIRLSQTSAQDEGARLLRDNFPQKWGPQASVIASNLYGIVSQLDKLNVHSVKVEETKRQLDAEESELRKRHLLHVLSAKESLRENLYTDLRTRFVSTVEKSRELEKELKSRLSQFENEGEALPSGTVECIAERGDGSQLPRLRPAETKISILAIDCWWSALWEIFNAPHTDATTAGLSVATKTFFCKDGTDMFSQVAGDVRRSELTKAIGGPLQKPPAEAAAKIETQPELEVPLRVEALPQVEKASQTEQKPSVPEEAAAVEVNVPASEQIDEVDATKKEPGEVLRRTTVTRSMANPGSVRQSYATAVGSGASRSTLSKYRIYKAGKRATRRFQKVYPKKVYPKKESTIVFSSDGVAGDDSLGDGAAADDVAHEGSPSIASETTLGNEMAALFRLGVLEEETPDSDQCLQSWGRKALLDCLQNVSVSSIVSNGIPLPERLKEKVNDSSEDDPDTASAPPTVPETVPGSFTDVGAVFRERALRFSSFAIFLVHSLVTNSSTNSDPHVFAEAEILIQHNFFCCATSRAKFFKLPVADSDCLRIQLRNDGVYAIGFRKAEADTGTCNVNNYLKLMEPRFSVSDTLHCPSVFETTSAYAQLCGHVAGSASFLRAYFSFFLNCTVLGRKDVMTAIRSVNSADDLSERSLEAVLDAGGAIARDGRMRVTLPASGGNGQFSAPVIDLKEFVFGECGSSRVKTVPGKSIRSRSTAVISRAREYRVEGKRTSSCLLLASIVHDRDPEPVHALSTGLVQTMNIIRLMSSERMMNLDILKGSDAKHFCNVTSALNAVIDMFDLSEAEKKLITSFDQSQNIAREERVNLLPGQLALVSELVPLVPGQSCAPPTPKPSEEIEEAVKLHHLQLSSVSQFSYLTPLFVSSACFTLPQ